MLMSHAASPQLICVCFTTILPLLWPCALLSWLCSGGDCLCSVVSYSPWAPVLLQHAHMHAHVHNQVFGYRVMHWLNMYIVS